jgi:hypothetical protein
VSSRRKLPHSESKVAPGFTQPSKVTRIANSSASNRLTRCLRFAYWNVIRFTSVLGGTMDLNADVGPVGQICAAQPVQTQSHAMPFGVLARMVQWRLPRLVRRASWRRVHVPEGKLRIRPGRGRIHTKLEKSICLLVVRTESYGQLGRASLAVPLGQVPGTVPARLGAVHDEPYLCARSRFAPGLRRAECCPQSNAAKAN